MKAIERTIYSLCEEIDELRESVKYYKDLYEEERQENHKRLNESLERSKEGIANALRLALAVTDDENGNLVIKKEDRKMLADNYKKNK